MHRGPLLALTFFLIVAVAWVPIAPAAAFSYENQLPHPVSGETPVGDPLPLADTNPINDVNLIEPPEGDQSGDAHLELPVEVPPGRLGMEPALAFTYDSGGGNGWVGLGWDLAVPEVAVDDRWGVPRYDGGNETETYLLDGVQVAPIAHRGGTIAREADRTFHTRVDDGWQSITRHGDGPANYWWESVDEDGNRWFFGGDPAEGQHAGSILSDDSGNVFRWGLREVRDPFGNAVRYSYDEVESNVIDASDIQGRNIYLSEIRYTDSVDGDGNRETGAYSVILTRDHDERPDATTSARGGFPVVTADRLRRVEVRYNDEQVRAYVLDYEIGAFEISLLQRITEHDSSDQELHAHEFTYHDRISSTTGYNAFGAPEDWNTNNPDIAGTIYEDIANPLLGGRAGPTTISSHLSVEGNAHLYTGFNPFKPLKTNSGGVKIGAGFSEGTTVSRLLDLNGNGLPDLVYQRAGSSEIFYKPNLGGPGGEPEFGEGVAVSGLTGIELEQSFQFGLGPELHTALFSIVTNAGAELNLGLTYFADVNASGLPDLVTGGLVLFNRLNSDGHPEFQIGSAGTPVPLGSGGDDQAIEGSLSPEDVEELQHLLESQFTQIDTLRRWVAPFNGTISIAGDPFLLSEASSARVAIQHNATEIWSQVLTAEESSGPVSIEELPISAGDRIYFRTGGTGGPPVEVDWDPEITYTNEEVSGIDPQGRDIARYRLSEDFSLASNPEQLIGAPFNGTLALSGMVRKNARTSDDVRLVIERNEELLFDVQVLSAPDSQVEVPIDLNFSVSEEDELRIRLTSNSRIDFSVLDWDLNLYYENAQDPQGNELVVTDPEGEPILTLQVPVAGDTYPVERRDEPEGRWTAPENGTLNINAEGTFHLGEFFTDIETLPDIFARLDLLEEPITVTVKRVSEEGEPGDLLGSAQMNVGPLLLPQSVSFSGLEVEENDQIEIAFATPNWLVASMLNDAAVSGTLVTERTDDDDEPITIGIVLDAAIHDPTQPSVFNGQHRGWSVAGYDSAGARAHEPINEGDLVLPDFIDFTLTEDDLDDLDLDDLDYDEFELDEEDRDNLDPDNPPFDYPSDWEEIFDDLEDQKAYLYYPDIDLRRWQGPDPQTWASSHVSAAARIGSDSALVSDPGTAENIFESFGRAPIKFGYDIWFSVGGDVLGGIIPGGIAPGGSYGLGWSRAEVDFIDLNGDGFPDIISPQGVQYTNPDGSLGGLIDPENLDRIRSGESENWTLGLGADIAISTGDSGGRTDGQGRRGSTNSGGASQSGGASTNAGSSGQQGNANAGGDSSAQGKNQGQGSDSLELSLGFTGALGGGTSDVDYDLIDMTGDGLPDAVFESGGQLMVALNLGYGFATPQSWGALAPEGLNLGRAASHGVDLGLSAGFNSGRYDFAGGMSASLTETERACERLQFGGSSTSAFSCGSDTIELIDVNGSGRPDMLREVSEAGNRKLTVAINTGRGFADEVDWGTLPDHFDAIAGSIEVGVGGYFTIGIGPLCLKACYLIINPGGGAAQAMGRQGDTLMDVFGDGFPDAVVSDSRDDMRVARNLTDDTNLLASIERPLGATIDLDYQRVGNTIDHGSSQWVLSQVTVDPGEPAGSDEVQRTRYHYWGGIEDALEREFYGYHTVVEEHLDQSGEVARRITRDYLNDSFHTSGLLVSEEIADAEGHVFRAVEQSWRFVDPFEYQPFDSLPDETGAVVRQLEERVERLVEGGEIADALVRRFINEYDSSGNLARTLDVAESGEILEILYSYPADVTPINVPSSIVLRGAEGRLLHHLERTVEPTGAITEVRLLDESGESAVTTIEVDGDGNTASVTGPPNAVDQRATQTYIYDGQVRTHVVSVTDAFGLSETLEYDLRFGVPTSHVDANAQTTTWSYDSAGRVTTMIGPRQQGGGTPTISVTYGPDGLVPWVMVNRVDEARPGETLDSVHFTDGLGRVRQVQEDATVHNPINNSGDDVTIVGHGRSYDALGREVAARHPGTAGAGVQTTLSDADSGQPEYVWRYDVLDRVVEETAPDGSQTRTGYSLGSGRDDARKAIATVTDPGDGITATYRDAREMVTEVRRELDGANVWTSYQHDPFGRLIGVVDDHGNQSRASYDARGNRTATETPSGGRIEFSYDLAGNLTREASQTLRDQDQPIIYHYEYDRLVAVTYPDVDEVNYEWGGPGASNNAAGRIQRIASAGGTEQRRYGSLGEIVEQMRTPSSARGAEPPTLVTTLERDAWGRILSISYPDGEALSYGYDAGGRVSSIDGQKAENVNTYVERLEYDRFGEAAFVRYGNGVTTSYTRNETSRSLARMSSTDAAGRLFQNQELQYDPVGNVIEAFDNVDEPHPSEFGGPVRWDYQYDDLNRLIEASAHWQSSSPHEERITVSRTFDTIDNMLTETQLHEVRGGSPGGPGGGPPGGSPGGGGANNPGGGPPGQNNQPGQPGQPGPPWRTVGHTSYVHEISYGEEQPHAPTAYGDRTFSYDADGQSLGWEHDQRGTRRSITWGSHGRPLQVADQGRTVDLVWDHAGELAVRRGPGGETAFINPYIEVDNGQIASKHYYAGSLRLATVLVRPALSAHGEEVDAELPDDWPEEGKRFFLHRDHAGDITYVTDSDGEVFQHFRYFPSGSEWVSEMGPWQWTRLRIADRDRDSATHLEHGVVRDYDASEGRWLSASRLDGVLGDASNGVYDPQRLHPFARDWSNPPTLADPDGSGAVYNNDELRRSISTPPGFPERLSGTEPGPGGAPPIPGTAVDENDLP